MLHFMAVWSTERQKLAGARHGFILYIVMAVLLALAILAFALNSFKQGTVTQLARTVDQNRLAILAQSANAELVAKIRSLVNSNPDSDIFTACRSIFTKPDPSASLNSDIVLESDFKPEQTLLMAQSVGYRCALKAGPFSGSTAGPNTAPSLLLMATSMFSRRLIAKVPKKTS